jgi:hypothetical protein
VYGLGVLRHTKRKLFPGHPFWWTLYLLYLDASGSPNISDATKHYTLVGVCVHEGTWNALDQRLRGLKARYAFPNEDFELHAMCFKTAIREQADVPGFSAMNHQDRRDNVRRLRRIKLEAAKTSGDRKKRKQLTQQYRRTDPFIHLTAAERSQLYEDSLELIGNHRGLVLFGEAIEKAHPAVIGGSVNPVRQAFEQVVTRFDAFLDSKGQWRQLSRSNPGKMSNGLIVMDRDMATEQHIEEQFADYRAKGHPLGSSATCNRRTIFRFERKISRNTDRRYLCLCLATISGSRSCRGQS